MAHFASKLKETVESDMEIFSKLIVDRCEVKILTNVIYSILIFLW